MLKKMRRIKEPYSPPSLIPKKEMLRKKKKNRARIKRLLPLLHLQKLPRQNPMATFCTYSVSK